MRILIAGWFCVQCIIRLSLGLGVSLLELYVFAHAIMTLVTYTLWWNKPLDIEEAEQMLLPEETEAQDLEFIAAMSLFSDLGQKWQPCLNPYGHPSLTILVQCDVGSIHAKLVEGACTNTGKYLPTYSHNSVPKSARAHLVDNWPLVSDGYICASATRY